MYPGGSGMRIEQYFYCSVDEDTENGSVLRQKSTNLPFWWESPYQVIE